ncbi:MAG TPA: OFA family MFS transporter [Phycisphaerae bacterium]|nr:OFA family MFS transporter [Phycisphaerae bacterium]
MSNSSSPAVRPQVMNRWMVVFGGVLIQLCLGAIYAWSVFTKVLVKAPFNFSDAQTQIVFSVGLATFAVFTIIGGRWQVKVGPTFVSRVGGLILAIGYVLAGLVERFMPGQMFPGILATVGLIGGAGIGLAYVVPIACCVKWFPDKKGLATGFAVAGFGFGALIWIKLADPGAGALLIKFGGVSNVFMAYGVAYFVLIMLGSIWMKNPPAGWAPAGWTGAAAGGGKAATRPVVDFESGQMLATPQFWMLWVMYVCGALPGLMVLGIIQLFAIDALQARSGLTIEAASALAATAAGVFLPILNAFGRIAWGFISDAIGRKPAIILMFLLQGVTQLVFFHMGGTKALLFLGAASVGFNFGGALALFPAVTADFFGNKNVGKNYGWMFTAYGVGGIVGPIMAGLFKTAGKAAIQGAADRASALNAALNAWYPAFIIAGVACIFAAVLALLLKPPSKPATAK